MLDFSVGCIHWTSIQALFLQRNFSRDDPWPATPEQSRNRNKIDLPLAGWKVTSLSNVMIVVDGTAPFPGLIAVDLYTFCSILQTEAVARPRKALKSKISLIICVGRPPKRPIRRMWLIYTLRSRLHHRHE